MKFSTNLLKHLYKKHGGSFYIINLQMLEKNFNELKKAFCKQYINTQIAYSYKANYTPAICKLIDKLGGYAEVSSAMEYGIAIRSGIKPGKIIVNGPFHEKNFTEKVLSDGAIFNIDSFYLLDDIVNICNSNLNKKFKIGIRLNFNTGTDHISRFGIVASEKNIRRLKDKLNLINNCTINSLHCHFITNTRSVKSYKKRIDKLIAVYQNYFSEYKITYFNIGGGFFSKMPDDLKKQFNCYIPRWNEYANALAGVFNEQFKNSYQPTLFIEPGMALVADIVYFVTQVVDIKTIRQKNYALLNASIQNVKPTTHNKNLAVKVFNNSKGKFDKYDLVGYTCLEEDCIYKDLQCKLSVGDYVVFENVGAYTINLVPPFMQTCPPVIAYCQGEYRIVKRREATKDVLATYVIE